MEINGIKESRELLKLEQERLKRIQEIQKAVPLKNDLRKNNNPANDAKHGNGEFDKIFQEEVQKLK